MIPSVCARDIRMAARARIAELGITYDTVDAIAGLPMRYTAKLLAEPPMRNFSVQSMFALLGAIALTPMLQPDAKQLEKLKKRPDWIAPKLVGPQYRMKMHSNAVHVSIHRKLTTQFLAAIGAKGGANSRKNIGKRRRRQIARMAAAARWAKRASIIGPSAAAAAAPPAIAQSAAGSARRLRNIGAGAPIRRARPRLPCSTAAG